MNLIDVSREFQTEDEAIAFLEKMRWPDGVVRCLTCGCDRISRITRKTPSKNKRAQVYQCLEPSCKQQFSATSGTIFNDTHLPLTTWFKAIALIVDAKKGMSAKQLQRHMGIGSYKTAWYLCHRIREAMSEADTTPLTGIVEVDETYIGGKTIRKKDRGKYRSKDAVVGMVERGGRVRFRHAGKGSPTAATMKPIVLANISREVDRVITDEAAVYPFAFDGFCASKHETIAHKYEYVRGDVYTNTIESAFSLLKRGIVGSFHRVSIKHLHRYLSEFEYRFNERKNDERFELTVGRMCQTKVLTYRNLVTVAE